MWKFKNPVRHSIPETIWPTKNEAANALLFQSITMGSTQAESRTWVPAMVPWRATNDGFVTKENLDWYRRFAKGRPGVLVVEATGVRDIPSGPLLRIGHDRFIPGLRQLVETVQEASEGHTKLFIQIIDFLSVNAGPIVKSISIGFYRLLTNIEKLSRGSWTPTGNIRQTLTFATF